MTEDFKEGIATIQHVVSCKIQILLANTWANVLNHFCFTFYELFLMIDNVTDLFAYV